MKERIYLCILFILGLITAFDMLAMNRDFSAKIKIERNRNFNKNACCESLAIGFCWLGLGGTLFYYAVNDPRCNSSDKIFMAAFGSMWLSALAVALCVKRLKSKINIDK